MEIVEVNGVRYQKIEQEPKRLLKGTKIGLMAAMVAIAPFESTFDYTSSPPVTSKKKETEADKKFDLVKEFELIEQKRSTRSRGNREWVVAEFHRNYIKIEDNA